MGKIVTVHSFRGGTGKSNIAANTAACIACIGSISSRRESKKSQTG